MRSDYLISFLVLFCVLFELNGQDSVSKSERSFSEIKIKKGTQNATLTNDYGKRWKMRVTFPKETDEKNSLIIALHWAGGGGTYKEFHDCLALPGLAVLNAIIVSPEGENQLWSTGNNVEKVRFISSNSKKYWNVDPDKIAVMGYSNGGNGSWYFAQHCPELFSAAIPIASAYPINQKINIPLFVIHGAKDELFELSKTKKWVMKTKEKGTDVTWVVNDSLSHFQGCAYIAELNKATEWLKRLWKAK